MGIVGSGKEKRGWHHRMHTGKNSGRTGRIRWESDYGRDDGRPYLEDGARPVPASDCRDTVGYESGCVPEGYAHG